RDAGDTTKRRRAVAGEVRQSVRGDLRGVQNRTQHLVRAHGQPGQTRRGPRRTGHHAGLYPWLRLAEATFTITMSAWPTARRIHRRSQGVRGELKDRKGEVSDTASCRAPDIPPELPPRARPQPGQGRDRPWAGGKAAQAGSRRACCL